MERDAWWQTRVISLGAVVVISDRAEDVFGMVRCGPCDKTRHDPGPDS